jgi:hypothetical protein
MYRGKEYAAVPLDAWPLLLSSVLLVVCFYLLPGVCYILCDGWQRGPCWKWLLIKSFLVHIMYHMSKFLIIVYNMIKRTLRYAWKESFGFSYS